MTALRSTGARLRAFPPAPAETAGATGRALTAVLVPLGALALLLVAGPLLWPRATGTTGPAVLAVGSLLAAGLLLGHGRWAGAGTHPRRALALLAGLLTAGQATAAVLGVGVNPAASGPQDLPLVLAVPLALVACSGLVRAAARQVTSRVLLDAAVALVALAALLEVVLRSTTTGRGGAFDELLSVGYPAVGVLLCAVGLVTFAGVDEPRRAAAGWLDRYR